MGYDASAYNVYGVKRKKEDLQSERKMRGCSHPETSSKFCAECGKPMFVTETLIVDLPQGRVDVYYPDYELYDRGGDAVIGIRLSLVSDNDINRIAIPDQAMFDEVKAFFVDNELEFSDNEVGLYLMMYHSY